MSEENPCIGICEIQDGYCIGCGRSADEIFGDTDSAPAGSDGVIEPVRRPVGEQPGAADD